MKTLMDFAGITADHLLNWITEMHTVDVRLRELGLPDELLTQEVYVQSKIDDFKIWHDLDAHDWKMMQSHLECHKRLVIKLTEMGGWSSQIQLTQEQETYLQTLSEGKRQDLLKQLVYLKYRELAEPHS